MQKEMVPCIAFHSLHNALTISPMKVKILLSLLLLILSQSGIHAQDSIGTLWKKVEILDGTKANLDQKFENQKKEIELSFKKLELDSKNQTVQFIISLVATAFTGIIVFLFGRVSAKGLLQDFAVDRVKTELNQRFPEFAEAHIKAYLKKEVPEQAEDIFAAAKSIALDRRLRRTTSILLLGEGKVEEQAILAYLKNEGFYQIQQHIFDGSLQIPESDMLLVVKPMSDSNYTFLVEEQLKLLVNKFTPDRLVHLFIPYSKPMDAKQGPNLSFTNQITKLIPNLMDQLRYDYKSQNP